MTTPAVDAALSGRVVLVAGLLRIEFPDHTLLLCDGAAELDFGGETYVGRDPIFGTLGQLEGLEETLGDAAPALQFTLIPPDQSAAVALSNPAMQNSPIQMWVAVVDALTGTIVPEPIPLFAGEIDVPRLRVIGGLRVVTFQAVGGAERFFDNEEGMRLSDSFHQSIWPGELGMSHITGVEHNDIWGPGDQPGAARIVRDPPPSGVRANF